MYYSFNPNYVLKPDNNRALIMPREIFRNIEDIDDGFEAPIQPIYAIILTFFNHVKIEEGIKKASEFLETGEESIRQFINSLIQNNESLEISNGKNKSYFPKNCIVPTKKKHYNNYSAEDFIVENVDLKSIRHYSPTDIVLMINSRCATDCFYCYADRRKIIDCKIPKEKIFELIDEAKRNYARSFEIIGGEFFLYKHWAEVLTYLHISGFNPYISTKIPLSEDKIRLLKNTKINDLQFSFDTGINNNLMKILNVDEKYLNLLKSSLDSFEKYNIELYIHTILNKNNQTIEDMKSIYEIINKKSNIKEWRVDLPGPSMYLENGYDSYRVEKNSVKKVYEYLNNLKSIENKIKLTIDGILPENVNENIIPCQDKSNGRPSCTANYSKIFILPNGDVTICEELYWHEQFIIGNILEQSLLEIWNSDYANYISLIPQNDLPKDSACSTCNYYIDCKSKNQTCWRDVIKGYGEDKWYYPDPSCEYAPQIKNHI